MEPDALVRTAGEILAQTLALSREMSTRAMASPKGLEVGCTSDLWANLDTCIDELRSNILGLLQSMETLLEGPHGFLHEYVSPNWELGALYTLLEYDVLERIPLDGSSISVHRIAPETPLPVDKLLRICRLIATTGILREPTEGSFCHTAISETLVRDKGYKSFIRFQLFETRAASVHLADSLSKWNPFWTGQSAFEHAWGLPMYDWHAKNPEKGKRFAEAMDSVSKGLDAGNELVIDWIRNDQYLQTGRDPQIIEIQGKTGSFSCQLATLFPHLRLKVQDSSTELIDRGREHVPSELSRQVSFEYRDLFARRTGIDDGESTAPTVFLLRSVLWSLDDGQVMALLQSFIPAMELFDNARILISDLVSPLWGSFDPHVERAYRRRDVTLMTMHNVKQRTTAEWRSLISSADPRFEITYTEKCTSHSCRGLWEVKLQSIV